MTKILQETLIEITQRPSETTIQVRSKKGKVKLNSLQRDHPPALELIKYRYKKKFISLKENLLVKVDPLSLGWVFLSLFYLKK